MRCTVLIGNHADDMQHPSIQPTPSPCPACGTQDNRQPVVPLWQDTPWQSMEGMYSESTPWWLKAC